MLDRQREQFHFTGNGGEYFRLWIVNVCLSIVTLGIYSAWAKVRRNQYFYRHTRVAGASFDYHGDPVIILKGRILAVLMFAAYILVRHFNPVAGLVVLAVIMLIMPWLAVRSLKFRLHNTSYRGLRFAFHGENGAAYFNLLGLPVVSMLTLGLLWPFAQQRIVRYTRDNSAFGNVFFKFNAGSGGFYRIYLMLIPICLVVFFVVLSLGLVLIPSENEQRMAIAAFAAGIGVYIGLFVIAYPYLTARLQNLIWNNTVLGPHHFAANLSARGLLGLIITNLLLIIVTLGLFKPFADIRLAKYRTEHLNLLPDGSLDLFVAGVQSQASAAGEEMADMFDFDLAI